MNFPRFWAKGSHTAKDRTGREVSFSCWGWSDLSQADAQRLAAENSRRVTAFFIISTKKPERYGYGTRPLREEVLTQFNGQSGDISAVLTRNAYGCTILNTARAMFVDIDIPALESSTPAFLRKLFGKAPPEQQLAQALERVETWTRRNAGWGWRAYRTRAGVRLLATHSLFDPVEITGNGLFEALGADPLYRKLCSNQKSFRARLTPKPWRIAMDQAPNPWPRQNLGEEQAFKAWEQKYTIRSAQWATCKFLTTFGENAVHPEIAPLIAVHDDTTKAQSNLELA